MSEVEEPPDDEKKSYSKKELLDVIGSVSYEGNCLFRRILRDLHVKSLDVDCGDCAGGRDCGNRELLGSRINGDLYRVTQIAIEEFRIAIRELEQGSCPSRNDSYVHWAKAPRLAQAFARDFRDELPLELLFQKYAFRE